MKDVIVTTKNYKIWFRTKNDKIDQRMLNAHARKNGYLTFQKADNFFVRVLKTSKNKGKKRH